MNAPEASASKLFFIFPHEISLHTERRSIDSGDMLRVRHQQCHEHVLLRILFLVPVFIQSRAVLE